MKTYFLDTSFILALEIRQDQNHHYAQQHWKTISAAPLRIATTTYVFDEIITFFNSRNLHQKAIEVGSMLIRSPSVQCIHVDESLFYAGWHYFQTHNDKRYSLTDCISFIVMQSQGIQTALTFDHHFVQAGLSIEPHNQ